MRAWTEATTYLAGELEKLAVLYEQSGRVLETENYRALRLEYAGCKFKLRFKDYAGGCRDRIAGLKRARPPQIFKLPKPVSLGRAYNDVTFASFVNDGDMRGAVSYAALFGREVFYEATNAGPRPLRSVSEIQAGIVVAYSLQFEKWGVLHIDSGRYLRKGCFSRAEALREYNKVPPDIMEKALAAAEKWVGFQKQAREKYHDLRP